MTATRPKEAQDMNSEDEGVLVLHDHEAVDQIITEDDHKAEAAQQIPTLQSVGGEQNEHEVRTESQELPTLYSNAPIRKVLPPAPTASIGVLETVTSLLWSSSASRSSAKRTYGQHEQERREALHSQGIDDDEDQGVLGSEQISRFQTQINDSDRASRVALFNQRKFDAREREWEALERKWQAREREWEVVERKWQTREREWEARERSWRAKERELVMRLKESESQKMGAEEEHLAFVRRQQEASFRQMESARWLPVDEGRVMGDLDKLKKDMRTWAKGVAVRDLSSLQSLGEEDTGALMEKLAEVAILEDGRLSEGLATAPRAPILLLNALLAHSIYTSFFQSPFFFLGTRDDGSVSSFGPDVLEDIYKRAQEANQQEAHTWRSQTLRLLMPPLRDDTTPTEKALREKTEGIITQIAQYHSAAFLSSPATRLLDPSKSSSDNSAAANKLQRIFLDAAILAYMLWTRRTSMRCFTFAEIQQEQAEGVLAFDAESEMFDADTLVRWDDHEDALRGRAVSVLVHPLLRVFGTDEARGYELERVWAKGVVWLDSKTV